MASNPNSNSQNLAKFAFNIYGTLNNGDSTNGSPPSSSSSTKSRLFRSNAGDNLIYNCERDVSTLTELELIPNTGFNNNVVIGGKNYLKLLILNHDQSAILNEANILEPVSNTNSRLPGSNKLYNFNTIKSYQNTVAGGMVSGSVILYQVLNNGKSRVLRRYTDHKRCINSLDFSDPMTGDSSSNLLIAGFQDGSIRLWDLRQSSDKPAVNILPKSNYDAVRSCQFSSHSLVRNKMVILSVHDSGTLNKYDIRAYGQSPQSQVVPERKWNFHTGPGLSLSIHPEKEYVLTGGRDHKVCVWNYGESSSSYNSTTPDYVLQTYGPVMKVRWCPYPNPQTVYDYDDDVSYDDKEFNENNRNPLFNYDFACSYLNEDPTLTIFNLKRKYVPKEIINSYSDKPYQNFIFAKNPTKSRKIWTLTKNNQFASRSLDSVSEFGRITRPQEILNPVSMDWGTSVGDLSFIAQERSDFENNDIEDKFSSETSVDPILESEIELGYNDSPEARDYNKLLVGSAPQNGYSPVHMGSSPVESPVRQPGSLMKSSTFNGTGHTPNKLATTGSPPTRGAFNHWNILESQRPSLGRNPSQSTIDSALSTHSPVTKSDSGLTEYRKTISFYHASPYVIPLSLPIPANDDLVFETLANNYVSTIPDAFSLVDVCLLNASVAASVNRFKDCQIWRMLAVGLGQHVDGFHKENEQENLENNDSDDDRNASHVDTEADDDNNDNKSISSEYGIVGSYNSNSTNTTNYDMASESTSDKKSSNPHSWADVKSSSTNNLMDMINHHRNSSLVNSISIGAQSPNASRSNSMISHVNNLRLTTYKNDDNENAVEDDEEEDEKHKVVKSKSQTAAVGEERALSSPVHTNTGQPLRRHSSTPNMANDKDKGSVSRSPPKKAKQKYGTSPKNMAILNRIKPRREQATGSFSVSGGGSEVPANALTTDLDNENLNVLHNAASSSLTSSNFSAPHTLDNRSSVGSIPSNQFGSFKSRRSSSIAPTYGFLNNRNFDHDLERVDETTSADSSRIGTSGLSKAIEQEKVTKARQDSKLEVPWTISNLLEKALEHATLQGDVILCSSLSLLFYPFIKPLGLTFLNKQFCLQWLSLYIEILNKKMLFVNSTNIVNAAPRELQEQLIKFYYADNLKFYCQYCNELIVNEETKQKFKEGKTKQFGYWFCEKCSKWQSNCVYCNEPCVGLNVVISLKCGHRGHFGCLKEWFIEDENLDCPGGCNEVLF